MESTVVDGIAKPTMPLGAHKNFEMDVVGLTNPGDIQARFRYVRRSDNSADQFYFEFRNDGDTPKAKRVLVEFRETQARILEHTGNGGGWFVRDSDTTAGSTPGEWYDVFIVAKGASIEVWRRGESESDITRILESSVIALTTNPSRFFRVSPFSDYWVDDIGFDVRNLDYFLHLSMPANPTDPTCIDTGDPNKGIGILNNFPDPPVDFERDFNDVISPYDILDFNNDLDDDPSADPYDMGAKEYPMPAGSSFWWANPLFD